MYGEQSYMEEYSAEKLERLPLITRRAFELGGSEEAREAFLSRYEGNLAQLKSTSSIAKPP